MNRYTVHMPYQRRAPAAGLGRRTIAPEPAIHVDSDAELIEALQVVEGAWATDNLTGESIQLTEGELKRFATDDSRHNVTPGLEPETTG